MRTLLGFLQARDVRSLVRVASYGSYTLPSLGLPSHNVRFLPKHTSWFNRLFWAVKHEISSLCSLATLLWCTYVVVPPIYASEITLSALLCIFKLSCIYCLTNKPSLLNVFSWSHAVIVECSSKCSHCQSHRITLDIASLDHQFLSPYHVVGLDIFLAKHVLSCCDFTCSSSNFKSVVEFIQINGTNKFTNYLLLLCARSVRFYRVLAQVVVNMTFNVMQIRTTTTAIRYN